MALGAEPPCWTLLLGEERKALTVQGFTGLCGLGFRVSGLGLEVWVLGLGLRRLKV